MQHQPISPLAPHATMGSSTSTGVSANRSASVGVTASSSSPVKYGSPISSMAVMQKPPLQHTHSGHELGGAYAPSSSSSSSSPAPDFLFSPPHQRGTTSSSPYASSTTTLASSPMIKSNSARPAIHFAGHQAAADVASSGLNVPVIVRPEVKRRRTAPELENLPGTPTRTQRAAPNPRFSPTRRGNGKHGEDVWPSHVDEPFQMAFRNLPKLGRKKVLVDGKPYGRNELIGLYILERSNEERSRKQISSHIQVLKNTRKHDPEFMGVFEESEPGDDVFTDADAQFWFPGHRIQAYDVRLIDMPQNGLQSPYSASFMQRSGSRDSSYQFGQFSAAPSPAAHYAQSPGAVSTPMSATSSLTHAIDKMSVVGAPISAGGRVCTIAPESLSVWAVNPETGAAHVFAQLGSSSGAAETRRVTILEDLPIATERYRHLVTMHEHLPCPFLHVKLNLSISDDDYSGRPMPNMLQTAYTLASAQHLDLTLVTSVYAHGKLVNVRSQELNKPVRASPHASSSSHLSPNSANGSQAMAQEAKYLYDLAFANAFWTELLGAHDPRQAGSCRFTRSKNEMIELAATAAGILIMQEFVVASDDRSPPMVDGQFLSNGTALGDVVLVVTHDLQVHHSPHNVIPSELTFLTTRRPTPSPTPAMPPMPMSRAPLGQISQSRLSPQVPHRPTPSGSGTRPTHGRNGSINKPTLSLQIPPAPKFSMPGTGSTAPSPRSGLHTPWPQMIHTPIAPPPVHNAPPAPAQHARLQQCWAQSATSSWDLTSPALMGQFPDEVVGLPYSSASNGHGLQASISGRPYHPYNVESTVSLSSVSPRQQQLPPGSRALGGMTAEAIAAGTPTIASFPQHHRVHGTPFVVHPSHVLAPAQVMDEHPYSPSSTPAVRAAEPHTPSSSNKVEKVPLSESKMKPQEVQDYFSGLLGSSTRYA